MVNIRIVGLDQFVDDLRTKIREVVEEFLVDLFRKLVRALKSELRWQSPRRTGRLAAGWEVYGRPPTLDREGSIEIRNRVPYANWLDKSPRSPHRHYFDRAIEAALARVLA